MSNYLLTKNLIYRSRKKLFPHKNTMTEIEPYKIAGLEIANIETGTAKLPYFYKITSGQKDTKSLIFHSKINEEDHQNIIR